MMKRNAFTMIEVVFVIVVLGILAAVAIPKLAATRDDAVNASLAQNIMVGAGEIASYAVAHGDTTADLSQMSNAVSSMVNSGKATLDLTNHQVNVIRGNINNCVKISVNAGSDEENLTVSLGNAGTDANCLALQSLIDMKIYPMLLRGTYVVQ